MRWASTLQHIQMVVRNDSSATTGDALRCDAYKRQCSSALDSGARRRSKSWRCLHLNGTLVVGVELCPHHTTRRVFIMYS